MKITDFVAEVQNSNGLARSNRYTIEIPFPLVMRNTSNYSDNDFRKMHLFCESAQIPGLNINTTQIRTFGEVREMPYEFNYDPVQFSFYVDGDMIIKGLFDEWIKNIQIGKTRNFQYYNYYISDQVKINIENMQDEEIHTVTLYEAYPKSISSIQVGYDQKDVMKMTVNLMYKYWTSDTSVRLPQSTNSTYTITQTQDQFLPEVQNVTTAITLGTQVGGLIAGAVTNYGYGNPMGDTSGFGGFW